ncbi:hypothetical protein RFI_32727 [Reticulomyxa filosa]|uniref:Cysteine protease n=1 Tax=Reticulomyxa filosa TaxID=46433 RepID=X6LVB5_RETFI|nr:hypothetical protein RFI_32727 [Reticulomyxa filosa]|eukprot:ETO04670.1 hypothetical protein RFI_32727 [Reticulomyxa filosa]
MSKFEETENSIQNNEKDSEECQLENICEIETEDNSNNSQNHEQADGSKQPLSLQFSVPSLSSLTQPLNTMFTEAKHHICTFIGSNPSSMLGRKSHTFSTKEPVWIMGSQYDMTESPSDCDMKEDGTMNGMERVVRKLSTILWITYRRGFEVIEGSKYTSDAGWGCMVRTTQMMCAQGLILFYCRKQELTESTDGSYSSLFEHVLSCFNDTYGACFSLHNMLKHSKSFQKGVGTWFGPAEACVMAVKCLQDSFLSNQIAGLVASQSNGVIYKSEITKLCCNEGKWEKAIFIFVPLRLGLNELNLNYIPSVLRCLEMKHSIGIVGGKPQRSLYFVGYQHENLLYLDPHTVFDTNKDKSNIPYNCKNIYSLNVRELDPSMALGFFVRDKHDFELFWEECQCFIKKPFPIFTIQDEMPLLDLTWEEASTNDHDSESSEGSEWENL